MDNPVGTGFSFVEDDTLYVKSDVEAATDLTSLLKELFNRNESLQKSPLFLVVESYGGKYVVTAGLSILNAIQNGELKLKLGGIALGDSWISPEDFVINILVGSPHLLIDFRMMEMIALQIPLLLRIFLLRNWDLLVKGFHGYIGSAWTCRKCRKHYRSFYRNGNTISVHNFVYVMAEGNKRLVGYVEDLYEDTRANNMVVISVLNA